MATKAVKVPLARVWSQAEGGTIHRTLAWGDRVDYMAERMNEASDEAA